MIDEKKIEEAAFDETFGMYGESESLESGIKQFLRDLWHSTREEPEDNRNLLIEQRCNNIRPNLYYYNAEEYNSCYDDPWDVKVRILNITRWLYIDDLLPKKGGEQ